MGIQNIILIYSLQGIMVILAIIVIAIAIAIIIGIILIGVIRILILHHSVHTFVRNWCANRRMDRSRT